MSETTIMILSIVITSINVATTLYWIFKGYYLRRKEAKKTPPPLKCHYDVAEARGNDLPVEVQIGILLNEKRKLDEKELKARWEQELDRATSRFDRMTVCKFINDIDRLSPRKEYEQPQATIYRQIVIEEIGEAVE